MATLRTRSQSPSRSPRASQQRDLEAVRAAFEAWRAPSNPPGNPRPRFTRCPFSLGVASGAPDASSVVLWTRLAPDPLNGGGLAAEPIEVRWEVAEDEAFRRPVRSGSTEALPGRGHSVHVEVQGLRAGRWYFYRFWAGDELSPVGRTRTAPALNTTPQRLRVAFASCQMFEQGYFVAYRHMREEDLDLTVFLGDYIYESSWGSNLVRRHAGGEPRTLLDYRNRHAQYKSDRDLQQMHASAPWLVTWDDHEVDNDYADMRSEDLDPAFVRRRTAAYQAYFEHMPLRELARPRGPDMLLHARYDFGRLARIHVLDGRQYRSPQACPRTGRGGSNVVDGGCGVLFDESRSMLGRAQERWLEEGLLGASGRWNVIAQQTLMARANPGTDQAPLYWTDAWDGYPGARSRLLELLDKNGLRSCLVLSGDAHTNYVCDLKRDFQNPRSASVATEFCVTSISSQGRPREQTDLIRRQNRHIRFADSTRRGYLVLDLSERQCSARLRVVGNVRDRDTDVSTLASFVVQAGRPGARRA